MLIFDAHDEPFEMYLIYSLTATVVLSENLYVCQTTDQKPMENQENTRAHQSRRLLDQ